MAGLKFWPAYLLAEKPAFFSALAAGKLAAVENINKQPDREPEPNGNNRENQVQQVRRGWTNMHYCFFASLAGVH